MGFDVRRDELIHQFTESRKSSLKALTPLEYNRFINWLNTTYSLNQNNQEDKQRKKIIALFCQMGFKHEGNIDMLRINNWCKSHGHKHQHLNAYHGQDLAKLVTQVDAMYKSFLTKI